MPTDALQDPATRPWHSVSGDRAVGLLNTDPTGGLDETQAEDRLQRVGPNKLPERKRDTLPEVFLRQFKDPLIYILLAAGAVSLGLQNVEDAAFIFAVLLLNAGLGTFQEYRAESAAQALQNVMKITAQVLRGGKRRRIDSERLVPGDIVDIEAGSAAPADLRLLQARDVRVDESLLTGESTPVDKNAEAQLAEDTPLAERSTLLHAGSTVVGGSARGVVCVTGAHTQIGRIAGSLAEEAQVPPLVVRMRRFTRVIAVAVLIVIVILGAAQLLRGKALMDVFFLAVALAVSAIPAGLPVAITVAMAIASNRMAARNVIVRKLPAVEGLGACTLIASDKTGTLTENKLTIQRLVSSDGDRVDVEGSGYAIEGRLMQDGETVVPASEPWLQRLATGGALCNEASLELDDGKAHASGDTVDVAFLVLAHKLGIERGGMLEQYPEINRIPFASERRFAASFHRDGDRAVAYVKGAAQRLAEMCDADAASIAEQEEELASRGYRVLGVACGEVPEATAEEADAEGLRGLRFLGLVGLIDPVRDAVPESVSLCHRSGVDVRMVTGDHPATALAVGKTLGIAHRSDDVTSGRDLSAAEEHQGFEAAARRAHIYARVEPQQKTLIVDALQDAGHFVAVTGDGVNDAPALKSAHIGVAMGASGTDVARNAADLILTDDNFRSIVNGIEEGRVAYDNVRKVIWLLISTGLAELVLFTLSVIADMPLPLTPIQLLWLNLVTNGIQDVAVAFEKGEPGVFDRPPRSPEEPIFNRLMVEEVITSGLYMGLVTFGVFYALLEVQGMDPYGARNLLLLLMVLFENVHAFNVRSETRSAFRIPLRANPLLVLAVLVAQGIHIASMWIPGWREVLEVQPVTLGTWALLLAITLSKFLVVEAYKWLRGRSLAHRLERRARAAA